jgi:hypothetical protein
MTASVRTRVLAQCKDAVWRLAPGFQLASAVDYVADRIDGTPAGMISEHGTACSGAMDVATCQAAVALDPQIGRHVLTTEGDQVKLWQAPSVLTLFGAVDTPEEAIWMLQNSGYDVSCSAQIGYVNHEFSVLAERYSGGCPPGQVTTRVLVSANGAMRETQTDSTLQTGQGCVTEGRRPEGLRSEHRPRGAARLGEHFAAMAHMEAASVPAFAAIASELRSYGAPAALVHGAERALRDEVRHARLTARLAQRFGAHAVAPVVERMPLRSLEAFALDNAVEGCVNETYAAAEASYRAARAADRDVAQALASIAEDETRHAELSWAIDHWVTPQLEAAAGVRIRVAQRAAIAELGDKLRAEVHPELCARAGVPDAHAARTLHARLARTLWKV